MTATRSTPSPSERSSSQAGSRRLPLPARSPNLNAYAERWVRSVKEECLSKIIVFGERSLRRALSEYVAHCHAERNHQGKSNVLLFRRATLTTGTGTEAYGWKVAPRYIIRDRDAVYGDVFIRRLRAMSIRDRPTAPRSPWQNGYCERAIGSIRRECLDHVVVFGERHLRHLLRSYATYYNSARTHLSINKDAPSPRTVQAVGRILPTPFLGGLHHLYVRV